MHFPLPNIVQQGETVYRQLPQGGRSTSGTFAATSESPAPRAGEATTGRLTVPGPEPAWQQEREPVREQEPAEAQRQPPEYP